MAELSPSFGSLVRNRFQDPAPDEAENNLDTGCPSQKIFPRITLKAGEKNVSTQKLKRKHRNVIVLAVNRQKPKMKDDFLTLDKRHLLTGSWFLAILYIFLMN